MYNQYRPNQASSSINNTYLNDPDYSNLGLEESPNNTELKSQLMKSQIAGPIRLNNTPIIIKPNIGKIDLKLFVGQIPKDWNERDAITFFSNYGDILEAQIIRDNKTQQSKGCAFVKFASMTQAEECIKKIQDKPVHLPGVQNAIQIKWADGEEMRLGLTGIDLNMATKLFVGSIPKDATEENLRDVFQHFGQIDELVLMKENGISKGCAFVKFHQKEDALLAIRALNAQAYIMDSDKPIEVRFAENKKSKPQHNNATGNVNGGPSGAISHNTNNNNNTQSRGTQGSHNHHQHWSSSNSMPYQQQQPPSWNTNSMLSREGITYYKFFSPEGLPYYYNTVTGRTQWEEPPYGSIVLSESEYGNGVLMPTKSQSSNSNSTKSNTELISTKKQGPPGCNLFVFHLPNEWKEHDLIENFKVFGNIISTRIMSDKQTGRSRGFGFISYDNPQSAKEAIMKMNGVQVCSKRLKVQLKKGDGEDEYSMMSGNNKYTPY